MADATSFNLMDGQKAERKLLVTAVNVGDSITASGTPEWQIVGCGVEDYRGRFCVRHSRMVQPNRRLKSTLR